MVDDAADTISDILWVGVLRQTYTDILESMCVIMLEGENDKSALPDLPRAGEVAAGEDSGG